MIKVADDGRRPDHVWLMMQASVAGPKVTMQSAFVVSAYVPRLPICCAGNSEARAAASLMADMHVPVAGYRSALTPVAGPVTAGRHSNLENLKLLSHTRFADPKSRTSM
jgi:hypothetical protein